MKVWLGWEERRDKRERRDREDMCMGGPHIKGIFDLKWVYCSTTYLFYFCDFITCLPYMKNQIYIFLIMFISFNLSTIPPI